MSSLSLKEKTDHQLVISIKKYSDDASFEEICRRYQDIFYNVCHKYKQALSINGIDIQDILDEKNIIIFNCIKTFKISKKVKLSTYIGNYARYLCLTSINKRKYISPSLENEVSDRLDSQQLTEYSYVSHHPENYKYIFNILGKLKDERVNKIFEYRYFSNKTMVWSKVAKKMKLSTQNVINIHNKALKLLQNKFNSENSLDIV